MCFRIEKLDVHYVKKKGRREKREGKARWESNTAGGTGEPEREKKKGGKEEKKRKGERGKEEAERRQREKRRREIEKTEGGQNVGGKRRER